MIQIVSESNIDLPLPITGLPCPATINNNNAADVNKSIAVGVPCSGEEMLVCVE